MKKTFLIFLGVVGLLLGWGSSARLLCMDLDWSFKEDLKLEASPLDVTTSSDGRWIFILVPERVLVYSASEKKMVKEIPVEKGYDRLSYSPRDSALMLSSGPGKRVSFIDLEPVYEFNLAGAPFRGPENAAVTVVVFSDYQ